MPASWEKRASKKVKDMQIVLMLLSVILILAIGILLMVIAVDDIRDNSTRCLKKSEKALYWAFDLCVIVAGMCGVAFTVCLIVFALQVL